MWLLVFQLIYVLPSSILYILTIWTITSQWSTFKSSFFQFYIFDFVMNVFTLLNTFYVLRLANYTCDTCFLAPLFRNIDEYVNNAFFYAVQYHMAYVAYISIFVASLNRLTVIRNYLVFEPLWRSYSIPVMVLITLLPTPNTVWMMTYGAHWVYEPLESRFLLHSPIVQASVFVFLLPFMVVSIVVSLGLNVGSMILVRRVSRPRRKFVETHFLKLIVITCAVQLVGTVLTVLLSAAPRPSLFFSIVLYATPLVSDCLTLCNPWLLLSLSKPIRDTLWRAIRFTSTPSSSVLILEARRMDAQI